MKRLLRFLTSKKSTAVGAVGAVVMLANDARFVQSLQKVGLSATDADNLTTYGEIGFVVLAALGYSPLKKPEAKG